MKKILYQFPLLNDLSSFFESRRRSCTFLYASSTSLLKDSSAPKPFIKLIWEMVLVLIMFLSLSACAGDDKLPDSGSLDTIYNIGLDRLHSKDYKGASEAFARVDQEFPYTEWSKRAIIMEAYSYYKRLDYALAIATLDRFLQLYPGADQAPYALYLKALCYYDQIADVSRDQENTKQAQQTLAELVGKFPESKYARDAKVKLDLVVDHLAGKEMEIARFYQKDGYTIAALNRYRAVVQNYQTSTHIEEALYRCVEIYYSMGLADEAKKYASILGYNYPKSKWYKMAYNLINHQ